MNALKQTILSMKKNIQSPHNIYLQVWNETGLVGLSGFLILILFQLKVVLRSLIAYYRSHGPGFPWLAGFFLPILAIYLFGLFDYDFFGRHMMHLYWLFGGWSFIVGRTMKRRRRFHEAFGEHYRACIQQ